MPTASTLSAFVSLTEYEAQQLHYVILRNNYPITSIPPLPPPSTKARAIIHSLGLPWSRHTPSRDGYTTYKLTIPPSLPPHILPLYFTANFKPGKIHS